MDEVSEKQISNEQDQELVKVFNELSDEDVSAIASGVINDAQCSRLNAQIEKSDVLFSRPVLARYGGVMPQIIQEDFKKFKKMTAENKE